MKRKKPQSQRNNIQTTYQGNNNTFKKNKSNLNTFRQNKDNNLKLLTNNEKRHLNKSHKESPRTIDYMQVMNKYSHLIEQNQELTAKNNEENNNMYKYNNYCVKTEINQDKNINKEMPNFIHYHSSNKIRKSTGLNNNDDYFQFCFTDYDNNEKDDNQNIFKYYTLKNFYQNKKNEIEGHRGRNNHIKNYNHNNIKTNEDNKNNTFFYNSYNRNKNNKNKEKIYYSNMNDNKNRTHFLNDNIITTVSLRKMSKKNTVNSHSLSNININKANEHNFNKININKKTRNTNIASANDLFFNNKNNIDIKDINQKMFNYNYYSEKIISLINLCQKYAKELNSSLYFIEFNHNINNDCFDELKNIINQFNKLMFSEKINNFFNNNTSNYNLNEFEPKTINLAEKFRSKIKDLKKEKSDLNEELQLYKKKYKTVVLEKEELNLMVKKLTKENEELCNQNKNLKISENKCYHQTNTINKLKCQIETLNIDIKYKENIINNLQQILEQIKNKSNIMHFNNITNDSPQKKLYANNNKNNKKNLKEIDKEKEFIYNGRNNISDFLLDVNSESIEKDIIFPKNLKVNSILESINIEEGEKKKNKNDSEIIFNDRKESEKDILKLKQNLQVRNYNNSVNIYKKSKLYFNQTEEPETFNKEMEKIDQDILNLKTKLKKIMTK